MCGIAGWVAFDRALWAERATLDAMTETLACRGPDQHGTWQCSRAMLGHRRLAIIDRAGGRQPMRVDTAGGPVVLVYSGEAYNFTELRTELAGRGQRFTTRSDTEVLLRGYLEWGTEVASHLNGMFAFAIWDARSQRLVMVRDRLGVKPLCYYPMSDGVLFASEAKAILTHPLAERAVGIGGLRELFGYLRTPGHAVWSGVHEVRPGTVVTVDTGGIRTRSYWSLRTRPHLDDRAASVAQVRELLEDIVDRQLVTDVPLCTLLSGGLDSSTLTTLAARALAARQETIRSFAVGFVAEPEDFVPGRPQLTPDAPYVHEVAAHAGTQHQDILLGYDELSDPLIRAKVVRARDLPAVGGDREVSLYLLFRAIRAQSTVALSGESADELFGGYTQFFDPVARQAETFPWLAHFADDLATEHAQLTEGLVTSLDLDTYVPDVYRSAVAEVERLPGESDFEYRMRRMSYLHLTRFVRALLDRKDRLSMAVGLEVRVPYCDHRLVEYVYNVPWALKAYDGREKSLLRAAAADLLPGSVRDRVKSGYPATQNPRYVAALQEQARDVLACHGHPVFDLVRRQWLRGAVTTPTARLPYEDRLGLERTLELVQWLDIYQPTIKFT